MNDVAPPSAGTVPELTCARCEYDLRATPREGRCPECGTPVADALRLAALPARPAWRDSDPHWRRRIIAGLWLLTALPVLLYADVTGALSYVPAVSVFPTFGTVSNLDHTFLKNFEMHQRVLVCLGLILLFAHERGRRPSRLDFTRRWGVFSTYVLFLVRMADLSLISALVTVGIGALFMSISLNYQPRATSLVVEVGHLWLKYGPQVFEPALLAVAAASSASAMLACVPLRRALVSTLAPTSRLRFLTWVPSGIIAGFAAYNLFELTRVAFDIAQDGIVAISNPGSSGDIINYPGFFRPELMLQVFVDHRRLRGSPHLLLAGPSAEVAKWGSVLLAALWLTAAQIATYRRRDDAHRGATATEP